jgi:NAD+ diphosphatase
MPALKAGIFNDNPLRYKVLHRDNIMLIGEIHMLHQIDSLFYDCTYREQTPNKDDAIFLFNKDHILLRQENPLALPKISDLQENNFTEGDIQYLFSINARPFFLAKNACLKTPSQFCHKNIQSFRELTPQWLAFAGVTAYHLSHWYNHNRYCGVCAAPLAHRSDKRALICPHCGNSKFPDIAIAIIVAVTNGDEILMTRYRSGFYHSYALIAGFVEVGESLYDTVKREVYEEVGLKVKNIRYYDNQPWGFSQSLLVGFFAELDGSRKITLEQKELNNAAWVHREDLTVGHSKISLSRKMISAYKNHEIL